MGNSRETIDVSEVADFSMESTTAAKGRDKPKKKCFVNVSSAGRLLQGPSHLKPPKGGFPSIREEGLISVSKW